MLYEVITRRQQLHEQAVQWEVQQAERQARLAALTLEREALRETYRQAQQQGHALALRQQQAQAAQQLAALRESLQPGCRITSYNVCYTKLLRRPGPRMTRSPVFF